jgi:hypothetical protein
VTGPPRDWDKELAEIDKIIAKQPMGGPGAAGALPAPAASPRGARPTAPATGSGAAAPARTGRTVLTTWIRVLLGVVVAASVTRWPYAHACGLALYGYLAAAGGVVLAGLWGAVTAWRRRMGLAHTLALLVAVWGGVLVGKAVLDRSDWAKQPAGWACP